MPLFLLIIGALLVLVGMGSIAAGAPDWMLGLSLGATLIQSGTIALVGGLIMIALGMVLIVLQDLLKRFDAAAANVSRTSAAMEGRTPKALPRQQSMSEPAPRREQSPLPGLEDFPDHTHEAEPAADVQRPRRPAMAALSGDEPVRSRRDPGTSLPADDEPQRPRRTLPRREEPAPARRDPGPIPPINQPFSTEPRRRLPESAPEAPELQAPIFRPLESAAPPPPPASPPAPANAAAETVVRSGVIGGMAYTLYADGSIEAELGIGTVRFNSIADLQEHVTRTGADADAGFDERQR